MVVTLIFFYAKTCATTKISTLAGYHVVLATLLFTIIKLLPVSIWSCSSCLGGIILDENAVLRT